MNRLIESEMLPKLREFFKKFPSIHLGNFVLRDMRMSDNVAYYQYLSNPSVGEYLSDEDIPRNEQEALDCVKAWGSLFYKNQGIFWTIADSQTDKLIGSIGLSSWNFLNRRAELSYDLSYEYWGKGITTRAISNVLKVAFNDMMLYRIEARTMEKNVVSQHILNKFKFQKEGILRGYRIIKGQPEDIYMYSLIEPDYPKILLK